MDYIEKITDNNNPKDIRKTPPTDLRIIDTDFDSDDGSLAVKQEKTVSRKQLTGRLNLLHFHDQAVSVHFEHIRDKRIISFEAKPQPSFGKRVICLWDKQPDIERLMGLYRFRDFTLTGGLGIIRVKAALVGINGRGVCFALPETSTQIDARKIRRYTCDLEIRLIQSGFVFSGTLVDFSPHAFRVEIVSMPGKPFQWINLKDNINLVISADNEALYSGECRVIRQSEGIRRKNIILEPLKDTIQRFKPKSHRSNRIRLTPSPNVMFRHPFTHRSVNLKVMDISGSGVSVEDDEESSVLLPGMVIPLMTLTFATDFYLKCRAQVVYRKTFETDTGKQQVRCGVAFLDMEPNDHTRLLSIIHRARNPNLYVCTDIDMDDLWDFFFKSGFLYPKKYAFIQKGKEKIKSTYEKLYKTGANISRHLTWQTDGVIQGHLSMLRFYENTWLIHHLAAVRSDQQLRIGVEILKHVGSFTYDSHRLFSSHMAYLICYFRPENTWPNYFFGGVAQNMQNPEACCVEPFAYLHFRQSIDHKSLPDDSWRLIKSEYEDLLELESFYERESGGLVLRALDLSPDEEMAERHDLATEYKKAGLKRKRLVYSLKKDQYLKAVIMANVSDFAINLSDLTRCVTIFIVDSKDLTVDRLYWAVSQLSAEYASRKFPILIYPVFYADQNSIPYEKIYNLWVLDTGYSDDYFKQLEYLLE